MLKHMQWYHLTLKAANDMLQTKQLQWRLPYLCSIIIDGIYIRACVLDLQQAWIGWFGSMQEDSIGATMGQVSLTVYHSRSPNPF